MNRVSRLVAFLVVALLFAGGQAQQAGGTLRVAWAQDPVGLDPQITSARSSIQILENVLDTLVTLDTEQNVVPSLAEEWSASDDNLTWTFKLRSGVQFSNGRALTADDVVYTYTRLLDPKTGSGNAYLLDGVTAVEAPDKSTVTFTLDSPNPGLLSNLAGSKALGIIAKENVEDDTINTQPIGTGPFVIADYQPGVGLTLEKNPNYWQEGLPYLDSIDVQIITDENVRRTALIAGDVDWSIAVPAQSVTELKGNTDLVVDEVPAGAYWYIGLNLKREVLSDVRVRQAIAMAVNRDNIAMAAAFGNAQPTQDPIPSSSAWALGYAPYTFDPEAAKALLAEAGYPDGFDLQIMPTTQYEESVRAAQVIQANLGAIGIRASINTLEWAQWLEEEGSGNYDTYICSWNGNVDPDDFFGAQQGTGEVFNFTGYSNPRVDELLSEGKNTDDFETRRGIYEQINKQVVDDAPYIYLYNPLEINVYRTNVKGYATRADQAIRFVETYLE